MVTQRSLFLSLTEKMVLQIPLLPFHRADLDLSKEPHDLHRHLISKREYPIFSFLNRLSRFGQRYLLCPPDISAGNLSRLGSACPAHLESSIHFIS